MGDKVVVEGKLCSWQVSDLHVGISIDAPMIEGDWAALSGRRVRVTVEQLSSDDRCNDCHLRSTKSCRIMPVSTSKSNGVVCIRGFWFDSEFTPEPVKEPEPVDRLAGCKCKRCGEALSVFESALSYKLYAVWCGHCREFVGLFAKTPAAAIDAYLVYQEPEPEPRCPHCGGVLDWSALMSCPMQHEARCRDCSALGWGKTKEAALDALKAWKPEPAPRCPFCGGKVAVEPQFGVYVALCRCGAIGKGPTAYAALAAQAEYLAGCPRCGEPGEYRAQCYDDGTPDGHWRVRCHSEGCGIVSPRFRTKPAVAQWWNKREGQHD